MTDHLQNIEAAPDWLQAECRKVLALFGFGDWRINVFICDMPTEGDRRMLGQAHPDSAYLQGTIYFNREITPEHKKDIYHECLHIVFSELEHVIDYHIIAALSEGLDGFYCSLYAWHWERLIERVARGMVEMDRLEHGKAG